jgi:hypothetical protein
MPNRPSKLIKLGRKSISDKQVLYLSTIKTGSLLSLILHQ